jgi:hypothetical protein
LALLPVLGELSQSGLDDVDGLGGRAVGQAESELGRGAARCWRDEQAGGQSGDGECSCRFEDWFRSEQRDCFFGFDEAGEVHGGLAKWFAIAGEDGLVPSDDDLGAVVDQAPESVDEPDALLHDEMHQVMGEVRRPG